LFDLVWDFRFLFLKSNHFFNQNYSKNCLIWFLLSVFMDISHNLTNFLSINLPHVSYCLPIRSYNITNIEIEEKALRLLFFSISTWIWKTYLKSSWKKKLSYICVCVSTYKIKVVNKKTKVYAITSHIMKWIDFF